MGNTNRFEQKSPENIVQNGYCYDCYGTCSLSVSKVELDRYFFMLKTICTIFEFYIIMMNYFNTDVRTTADVRKQGNMVTAVAKIYKRNELTLESNQQCGHLEAM